jgi:dCTP deaminase
MGDAGFFTVVHKVIHKMTEKLKSSTMARWNHGRSGILVDHEIERAQKDGLITIDPFSKESVEPATYDLRVGDRAVISTSSKVLDLKTHGLLMIEPGAIAILQSLEIVKLSSRIVGRLGPKTSLLRKGIFVSVGPQIDPGFEGRLIVNLINLSPRPFSLRYEAPFLTVEFHLLVSSPTRTYRGPHQNKMGLSEEEIEILMSYQGPTLADLHRGFAEMRDNIRDISVFGRQIPRLIEAQERGLEQTARLNLSLESAKASQKSITVPIDTFSPEPYFIKKPILAVVQPAEEGCTASFYDANIHTSGDNEEEALENLKSLILDVFESLSAEPQETLGSQPKRQLAVLHEFLTRS